MPRQDISDRLQEFLVRSGLHYKTLSKSYVFDCPKCHKREKLWMFRDSGGFKCWSCGDDFSGAPEFALAKMTGQALAAVRSAIRGTAQITGSKYLDISFGEMVGDDDDTDEEIEVPAEPEAQQWPYHCWPADHPHAKDGVAYMVSRGISQEMMLRYDVRYSTVKRAVAFPCWVRGKLLGWQYRTIDKVVEILPGGKVVKRLRLISESIPRDRTLMFSDRITSDFAVLCEGPVDALKLDLVGGGNVASMGKAVAAGQVQALLQAGITKLFLALDPDAVKELDRLTRDFEGVEVRRVVIPAPYKDLGEMPLEAARDAVLAAKIHSVGRILPVWFDFGRRVG